MTKGEAPDMHPTLFVDAFGCLIPIPDRVTPVPDAQAGFRAADEFMTLAGFSGG